MRIGDERQSENGETKRKGEGYESVRESRARGQEEAVEGLVALAKEHAIVVRGSSGTVQGVEEGEKEF